MDKIIFFHMNQLGDLLFSLPILEATRKQYPNIKIYSVVKQNLVELLDSTGLVDKIFIKEKSFVKRLKLIKDIKRENIQTAVLFSESPETLITAFLSNIKKRFGFKTASLKFLLTNKVNKIGVPSLSNNITLAQSIGLTKTKENYVDLININPKMSDIVSQWLKDNNVDSNFIVISMGASARRQEKCLNNNVWVETIDKLQDKKIKIVVVGAQWEKKNIEDILSKCHNKVNIFCPEGGLLELAALIKQSKLFIGIDSGTMHLSASLGIKCIALYGNTDPNQIGPQPLNDHIIIKKSNIKDIKADDIINTLEKNEREI
ncbi:MAG: glycosyltransferase family 9 protein [Endomicrobiaceae bacterium]|nr:glycosyltransferase family 9 protein [Endomicrobiaceae bacterium]MDD3053868.1 glycosyltransferase family 9 protein [Endomicrobiaceae bacterium]MDD3923062.1 glycosyltransferase family 9 protein [Endomicrobiaceae bacterium]